MRYQYIRRDGRVVRLHEVRHLPSAIVSTLRPHPVTTPPAAPSTMGRTMPMPAIPALPPESLEISAWW